MAHLRKQVREAARARLLAIPGMSVPENIARNITEREFPAAVVSTPFTESSAPGADQSGAGTLSLHDVTLMVVVVLDGEIGEDEIDELSIQIEQKFSDDLDGLARFVAPIAEMMFSIERMADDDGQAWLTFAEFEFSVGVVTTLGNPEEIR